MMSQKLVFIIAASLQSTWNLTLAFSSLSKKGVSFHSTTPRRRYSPTHIHTILSSTPTESNEDSSNDEEENWQDQLEIESRKRFEELTKQFLQTDDDDDNDNDFPSTFAPMKNPFQNTNNKDVLVGGGVDVGGGKASLYSNDEMMNLLSIHNDISVELNDEDDGDTSDDDDSGSLEVPSIHDLVKEITGTKDDDNNEDLSTASYDSVTSSLSPSSSLSSVIDENTQQRVKNIQAIASDVDGTILSKKQTIHPKTIMAIRKAIQSSSTYPTNNNNNNNSKLKYFFPATGKSRKGALDSISKASIELSSLIQEYCPGVYLQGLYCVDHLDNVVFEKKLNINAIAAAEELVFNSRVSIVGYDGDDLYTTKQNEIVIHLHEFYGEPLPILLPKDDDDDGVRPLSSHKPSMHKLLIMDDDISKLTNEVRPKLEQLASQYDACVTQALPTMLELLPRGCSKAVGVAKLCEALSIDVKEELLAIGDAENDSEMLSDASIGVAVGNACPIAKESAGVVLTESNDQGGAGVAIELFALKDAMP